MEKKQYEMFDGFLPRGGVIEVKAVDKKEAEFIYDLMPKLEWYHSPTLN